MSGERYEHAATVLRLWIANTRGEMGNAAYRRRHAHEQDYLVQREGQIQEMEWLASQAERAATERKGA